MKKAQFVIEVLKGHKVVIADAWKLWQDHLNEDIARMDAGEESTSEAEYPDGFKDFLVEYIDELIEKENGTAKNNPVE